MAVFKLVGGLPVWGSEWRTACRGAVAVAAAVLNAPFAERGDPRECKLLISSTVNTGL